MARLRLTPDGLRLTPDDLRHCRETWEGLQDPCGAPDCADGGCDCQASEIIMTSLGYVDVCHDGDVVAYGRMIAYVGD